MLYAIHGKIGAGKDTLGKALRSAYLHKPRANDLVLMKFADPLKEMVVLATGCTRAQLEDNDFKSSNMSVEWNHTITEASVWLYQKHLSEFRTVKDDLDLIIVAGRLGFQFRRTYREFLIEVGMKMRDVHTDFWINSLMTRYRNLGSFTSAGITDLRFGNEFFYLKQIGAVLIKITRSGSQDTVPEHIRSSDAETSLDEIPDDKWDHIIVNDGSLEDLFHKAKKLIR